MKYIICYDISDDKLRRRVVKYLESMAYRLQYSVFQMECSGEKIQRVQRGLSHICQGYQDVILTIVPVCSSCQEKIWQHGRPVEESRPYVVV